MLLMPRPSFFFFNDTTPTEIYTLSLHDALPIWSQRRQAQRQFWKKADGFALLSSRIYGSLRSEEHTSELQSRRDLVCRLLLEKKKKRLLITVSAIVQFLVTVLVVLRWMAEKQLL